MKRTTLSHHIEAFRTEALMLLRFQLAYNRIINLKDYNKTSRSNFVDHLIALKAIENDLAIRICKFCDNNAKTHSFKNALNEVTSSHINKINIETKVKLFNSLTSKLKNERRHTQLAHLQIGTEDNEYEIHYNFTSIIKLIIEIIDLLNREKVNYTWKDGNYEIYDLRKEVLNESKP